MLILSMWSGSGGLAGRGFEAHDYALKVIFDQSEHKVTKAKTRVLSENVAVVHARMRLKGQSDPAEKENKTMGNRYTVFSFVCQRQKGVWLIVSAQNTDIVPGAETNINEGGK